MHPSRLYLRLYSLTDSGLSSNLGIAERGLHSQIMRLVDEFGRLTGADPDNFVPRLSDALCHDERDRRTLRRRVMRLRDAGELALVGDDIILRTFHVSQAVTHMKAGDGHRVAKIFWRRSQTESGRRI